MKTPFRTILISTLATVAAFFSVIYVSCKRDRCATTVCANNGVCNNGTCLCPTGYSGTNCQTISRQKFLNYWQVSEQGSITHSAQYPITIVEGPQIDEVEIQNVYNFFTVPILGKVSGKNGDTLTIPNQDYQGKVVFGTGYIFSNSTYGVNGSIVMSYEVIDTTTNKPNDFGVYYLQDGSSPSAWNR